MADIITWAFTPLVRNLTPPVTPEPPVVLDGTRISSNATADTARGLGA
jgi:hypothetical protein